MRMRTIATPAVITVRLSTVRRGDSFGHDPKII
jgi:hypothetical protein